MKEKIIGYLAMLRAKCTKKELMKTLKDESGELYIDKAVMIIIVIVLGALLLAGLYAMFKDTLIPKIVEKIENFFNYNG